MMSDSRTAVILTLMALLVAPFVLFSYLSIKIFESHLLPEIETQTETAITAVNNRIKYAIGVFGGPEALRGVDPVFESARSTAPGISLLAMTRPAGQQTDSQETGIQIDFISAINPEIARSSIENMGTLGQDSQFPGLVDGPLYKLQELIDLPLTGSTPQGDDSLLLKAVPISENLNLVAGLDLSLLNRLKQSAWLDTGVIVLAIVLIAIEILTLVFAKNFLRPNWQISFITARLAVGDFRFFTPISGGGQAKRFLKYISDQMARIRESAMTEGLLFPADSTPRPIRSPSVAHIRLPLFLFFLSEAILRPILPQFLGNFTAESADLQIGLIMSSFLAASLITVFFGSIFSERFGVRKIFFLGALLSFAGMAGHLFAAGLGSIILARTLTGLGYGLVYAAAQVYIAMHADSKRRSLGFSQFLSVLIAAEIAGPAIGGIMADRVGVDLVLIGATAVIALAAMACFLLISRFNPDVTDPVDTPGTGISEIPDNWTSGQWNLITLILRNPRFIAMIACFAIPAKMLLTGGLFFLIPLIVLKEAGAAESARILMGYGLAILFLSPLLASLADRWRGFSIWVALGGILSGMAFALPYTWEILIGDQTLLILFIATLLFGIGQALSIPTQISFLIQISNQGAEASGVVLGVFRLMERIGAFLGPVLAGILLLQTSPEEALMWLGISSFLTATLGMSLFVAVGEENEEVVLQGILDSMIKSGPKIRTATLSMPE
ncbi:MAG: MFS transporter [Gammaproteobacteria bacterium]|nr:MFS transporter [Gammaproteobacteria bacterium]MCY4228897.1 MFS transporter [Gammaproteobacteria bacterium]